MKNNKLFVVSALLVAGLLAACNSESKTEESSKEVEKIEVVDNRTTNYVTVVGENGDEGFVSYEQDKEFASLYAAVAYAQDEGEAGSYVYRKGSETKTPIFVKQDISEDSWFYYNEEAVVDGYYTWLDGDVEWYKGEKYSRIMCGAGGYNQPTEQPYYLMGHETKSTQAWNRLKLLDAAVRYNPHAFTGIQTTNYTFELSQAKIRPSLNAAQKVIPMVTLSTTDSYNWSNQGIYMDTTTGNWYTVFGETQQDVKDLEYESTFVMGSTWDATNQEFTPEHDVKFTFKTIYDEEDELVKNTLKIEVLNADKTVANTIDHEYVMNAMTKAGTHRAQIALDLVPTDEDEDETCIAPDFMCGAYIKNAIVSEGTGYVDAELTDDVYEGDTDMLCEPGQTYDLLYAKEGYTNDADTEVILDNYACISYDEANKADGKDTWNIEYTDRVADKDRSKKVAEVEELIAAIPDGAKIDDAETIAAYNKYKNLDERQKNLIETIDGYTALKTIINAQ